MRLEFEKKAKTGDVTLKVGSILMEFSATGLNEIILEVSADREVNRSIA